MSRMVELTKRPGWTTLAAIAGALTLGLAGCGSAPELSPAELPLTKQSIMLLGKKGMTADAPIFVRIFKEESELEIWKARDDGRFYHFKTYPICHWSGELGPKQKEGDKQAPEGFYTVAANQLNPNSQFHVSFNLGYPNAYDRAHGRNGQFLMVHGKCKSAGCYAMTDGLMEEIYALAREALRGGQKAFDVHAYPFRMTDENMARHKTAKWMPFWKTLKEGYDHFEAHRIPPSVAVCERKYHVNVAYPANARFDADDRCPSFTRPQLEPFVPKPSEQQIADERITMPGPKTRTAQSLRPGGVEPLAGAADALSDQPAVAQSGGNGFGRMLGLGAGDRDRRGTGLGFAAQ